MKYLLLATAFTALAVMPAMAEVTIGKSKPVKDAQVIAIHKIKAGNSLKTKTAFKALREECAARVKAAETPELRKGVLASCRANAEALRAEVRGQKQRHAAK